MVILLNKEYFLTYLFSNALQHLDPKGKQNEWSTPNNTEGKKKSIRLTGTILSFFEASNVKVRNLAKYKGNTSESEYMIL